MEELEELEKELVAIFADVKSNLSKVEYARKRLARAHKCTNHLRWKFWILKKKSKTYRETIAQLQSEIDGDSNMTTDQILAKAKEVQKQSISSLDNSIQLLLNSKEIGANMGKKKPSKLVNKQ